MWITSMGKHGAAEGISECRRSSCPSFTYTFQGYYLWWGQSQWNLIKSCKSHEFRTLPKQSDAKDNIVYIFVCWNGNLILWMKLSWLFELSIVNITSDAASDENSIQIMTFPFQWYVLDEGEVGISLIQVQLYHNMAIFLQNINNILILTPCNSLVQDRMYISSSIFNLCYAVVIIGPWLLLCYIGLCYNKTSLCKARCIPNILLAQLLRLCIFSDLLV